LLDGVELELLLLGAAVEDWLYGDELVFALALVLAAVDVLVEVDV